MSKDKVRREMVCVACGENLGEQRPNWAKEHLEKYPEHAKTGFEGRIIG
ncbi:MAG TPA: hypothetical protein VIH27_05560 [Nitrososphaerales archaeon]